MKDNLTTIEAMYRFGSGYHVRTACGHYFHVTRRELDERQLFIGKRIPCAACACD